MLEIYPILCDLWCTIEKAIGNLQKSLDILDKRGEMPCGLPDPVSGIDRYIILFTQKFFEQQVEMRRAITLHEVGHFYIYQTRMLENLRSKWPSGEDMFAVFVSFVKQDQVWYDKNKEWLRRLYESYVFNVLKIPGEIYANLWVKENFTDAFNLVVESQLAQCENLTMKIDKTIKTKVIKFPIFSIILRLEGLLLTINGTKEGFEEKTRQLLGLSWEKMSRFLQKKEIEAFRQTKQEVMRICSSLQSADKKLFGFFEKLSVTIRQH